MNPNDVFPQRNLPDPAVPWGRELETRVKEAEKAALAAEQGLKNSNRTTAAVTSELARQLKDLEAVLEGLEDLYDAIPKTSQSTNYTTNFPSSVNWYTVNSIHVEFPEGSDHCEISAFGNAGMSYNSSHQGLATLYGRIVVRNGSGPYVTADEFSVAGGYMAVLTPQQTRSLDGAVDFDVQLQVRAEDSASFPSHADNYASLTVLATFTG